MCNDDVFDMESGVCMVKLDAFLLRSSTLDSLLRGDSDANKKICTWGSGAGV